MLTDNKEITTSAYWDSLISGKRLNASIDSSNSKKTSNFDRFTIVADLVEGPYVMEVAAGHARISAIVKAKNPYWKVQASDQSEEAKKASKYYPYFILSVYEIPVADKDFDTLIATQCFEYFEFTDKALTEFKRVAKKGVFTFSNGEMALWSQLVIYTPELVKELVLKYGEIEHFEVFEHIILVKIKFNEI